MPAVDAAFIFTEPVPVDREVLGETFDVVIGERTLSLTFPVIGEGGWLRNPRGSGHERLERRVRDAGGWGHHHTTDPDLNVVRACLTVLDPESVERADEDAGVAAVMADHPRWSGIFGGWTAAWSCAPVRPLRSRRDPFLFLAGPGLSAMGLGRAGNSVWVGGTRYLSRAQVEGALRRASADEPLPIEHRLLLEAQYAMFMRDERRCVIDAATAVEVAASNCISEELDRRGGPGEFIEQATRQANGIVGLRLLLRSLGRPFPCGEDPLKRDLAEPRNRAAHGGVGPTQDEARAAYQLAKKITGDLRPLPTE